MNKLRQYFTPFTACMLALVVVLVPSITLAQSGGAEYWIQQIVWTVLINISGMFLSAGGIVFDFAINSFVIGFADYFTNSGVGFAVDRTWVTIRDFVNLFFIFGLVYIGFKMILDADDSNMRRWLVNLIIAALLINFSLFITKFIIDFSNQISTQIAISGFEAKQVAGASATGLDSAYQVDISKKVLDLMGISSLFGLKGGGYNGYGWGYIFGTTIMFLVTAFVFFAGAFILTIRFAMLNLFMVLSPFMFIGWILPPLSNLTSKYWDAFFRRAFFAPVYFLFLYFSFEIMKAFRTSLPDLSNGNSGNMFSKADAAATIQATQSTLPFFILICIFLIASIVIAQKIGADGAGTAIKYGHMARRKAQRFTTAQTAGRAARIAGAGAARAEGALNRRISTMAQGGANSQRMARFLDRTAGAGLRGSQNLSIAGAESYSARNTRVGQQNARLNELNRQNTRATETQAALGVERADPAANQADAREQITARQDARRQARNQVGSMSNDEILGRAGSNMEELMSPEFASLLTDAHVTALRNSGLLNNAQIDELEQNRDEGTFAEITSVLENSNASTEQLTTAMEDLGRVMSTMSNDRLQGMMRFDAGGNLTGPLTNQAIASRLSNAQVDTMRQSGQASTAQMGQITGSRNAGLARIAQIGTVAGPRNGAAGPLGQGAMDAGFQDRQRRTLFRNAQDAAALPPQVLASAPDLLTPRIIDEFLRRNPGPNDMQLVRAGLQEYLTAPGTQATPAEITTWTNWNNNPNNVMASRFNLF